MADYGGNGGSGDVVDRLMDEGATMEPEEEDQTAAEMTAGKGAAVGGGGGDRSDQQPVVEDEAGRRALEGDSHAPKTSKAVGPGADAIDTSMNVEGSETVDGSSGGARGGDVELSESPPRDSARGKGVLVEEEVPMEVQTGPVEFQPAVRSSSHKPVSKGDFVEFVDDATLAQLLRDNTAVVAAREE